MEYRARWDNGTLRLMANNLPDLDPGEIVTVTIERGRQSRRTHQVGNPRPAAETR